MDAKLKQAYSEAMAFMKTRPGEHTRWFYYGNFKRKLEQLNVTITDEIIRTITDILKI